MVPGLPGAGVDHPPEFERFHEKLLFNQSKLFTIDIYTVNTKKSK